MSLLSGHLRAESLNLVGAEMAVRIEQDGGVTVFAGADKHPIATASVPSSTAAALLRSAQEKREQAAQQAASANAPRPAATPAPIPATDGQRPAPGRARDIFAALLSWIDGIGETGLDGHGLRELGLKDGNLTVDDERTGKHWTFKDITLSARAAARRRRRGHDGLGQSRASVGVDRGDQADRERLPQHRRRRPPRRRQRPAARLAPRRRQYRDRPAALSATLHGEIGPDGVAAKLVRTDRRRCRFVGDAHDEDGRLALDRAEIQFNWDAANRVLSVPFQILSGGNRITLIGRVDAPEEASGNWAFKIGGGTVVLTAPGTSGDPLVLNRIAVSGRYDATKRRLVVDEGDFGNSDVGVAMSGNLDLSGEPRLAVGVAGTRMPVDSLKRIWPVLRLAQGARLVQRASHGGTRRAHRHRRERAARIAQRPAARRCPTTDCRSTRWRPTA